MRSVLALSVLLLLVFGTASHAFNNVYIDGLGAFTQTTDAKNQYGGGGSLLYQVSDDFNFFVKDIYTFRKIADESSAGEKYFHKYNYFTATAGLEYLYSINRMPLYWKNAAGLGIGKVHVQENYDFLNNKYLTDKEDTGVVLAVWTGLMYVFTQHISVYADIGFHKAYFFDELKDDTIMGVQALVGVRFTVWGLNKSIYSEY